MDNLIIFCAKYLIFVIALICLGYWLTLDKRLKIQLALAVIAAAIIAVIIVKLAGKLYYHPRPFVVEHIKPLVTHSNDNGFPSEHATFAMMLATVIYFYKRKLWYLLFLLTIVVSWGRVEAHVHSTIDIDAGILIGAVAAILGHYIAERFLPLRPTKQESKK